MPGKRSTTDPHPWPRKEAPETAVYKSSVVCVGLFFFSDLPSGPWHRLQSSATVNQQGETQKGH